MPLVSLVEWNVSLGSADVSWGGVRAIRTAAKETTTLPTQHTMFCLFYHSKIARNAKMWKNSCSDCGVPVGSRKRKAKYGSNHRSKSKLVYLGEFHNFMSAISVFHQW